MYYSLDRFEEDFAVLQDDGGGDCVVPRAALPAGAAPGSVYTREESGWREAPDEGARRRRQVADLQARLLARRKKHAPPE